MSSYYVRTSPQSNGDHEVHESSCSFLPDSNNRRYLGEFGSCIGAVAQARLYYSQVNGCFYCSRSCHTQ